jgi:hypothetical protein
VAVGQPDHAVHHRLARHRRWSFRLLDDGIKKLLSAWA